MDAIPEGEALVGEPKHMQNSRNKRAKKISFSDDMPIEMNRQRKESVAPPPPDKRPEWYQDLTEQQINMFKEVFEMLDKDGGGSIDSEELYALIKDMDIDVSLEEIKTVLHDLDQDGNGEIDFDEFLFCMAGGGFAMDDEKSSGHAIYNKRQTLFFTAITRFAIKNSLGEIERYYANKVRYAPHVISCYTAGVRLIGLNDHQLEQEIRRMHKEAKNHTSPYAKPLPFVTVKAPHKKRTQKKKKKKINTPKMSVDLSSEPMSPTRMMSLDHSAQDNHDIFSHIGKSASETHHQHRKSKRASEFTSKELEVLTTLEHLKEKGNVVAKIPDIHLMPQIRAKLEHGEQPIFSSVRKRKKAILQEMTSTMNILRRRKLLEEREYLYRHGPRGWVIPPIERGQAPLPVVKLSNGNIGKTFTIEDVPDIRKWVSESVDVYYSTLKKAHVKTAITHWKQLHTDQIKSQRLRELFRKVYRAYSPHEEDEVFAISPWIPGPWYFKRMANTSYSGSSTPGPQLPARPSCGSRASSPCVPTRPPQRAVRSAYARPVSRASKCSSSMSSRPATSSQGRSSR